MSRSFALVVSALVPLLFLSGARADDESRAVIEKAIKAHGGEELLTKNKATRSKNKGTITLPGVGEVPFEQETAVMLPDRLRDAMVLTIGGRQVSTLTLVDGDKVSIEVNGKAIDTPEAAKTALADARHMMKVARLVTLLREKGFELNTIGEDKVEDKPVVGVRVSMKEKKDISLYFDKKTHLLAKVEHRTTDTTGNEISEERIVREYQKNKAGVNLPKKVIVKRDGKTFLEAEFLETQMLEKIDASEFKK